MSGQMISVRVIESQTETEEVFFSVVAMQGNELCGQIGVRADSQEVLRVLLENLLARLPS